ncbi:hypothetical protein F5051DRAFT_433248 [Lentinula edodes]|nr:hypothetical protein F5051DRAFT_433248 [Lentinula edodes]
MYKGVPSGCDAQCLKMSKIQVHPENDSCMVYQTANIDCINKWVERTLIVHEDIPVQAAPSTSVGTVSLLLHTHHAVFDGVAARNILAKIMGLAGQADRMCMDLKWGNEAENLTPAVFAILSDDEPLPIPTGSNMQPTTDLPYYKSLNWFWNCLEIGSKLAHQGVYSFDIAMARLCLHSLAREDCIQYWRNNKCQEWFEDSQQEQITGIYHYTPRLMEVTQGCHAKHKDLPAKLSYMAQVSEIFGAALKRDSMAGLFQIPKAFGLLMMVLERMKWILCIPWVIRKL